MFRALGRAERSWCWLWTDRPHRRGQKGRIAIQAHTTAGRSQRDLRQLGLSTASAHAAYYMLVRSGVDEHRIEEVAGFADRQPKDPADPLAAVNRRIEILLETD